MTRSAQRWRRFVILTAAGLALWTAAPASAAERFRESGVQYLQENKPWVQWVATAVFAAGCLAVAFKNPHRSHLD